MKEAGVKSKKKKIYTEDGDDDCGDDLSGLGVDKFLLFSDIHYEDSSEDEHEDIHLTIPSPIRPQGDVVDIFNAIATLCYGKDNYVDLAAARRAAARPPGS